MTTNQTRRDFIATAALFTVLAVAAIKCEPSRKRFRIFKKQPRAFCFYNGSAFWNNARAEHQVIYHCAPIGLIRFGADVNNLPPQLEAGWVEFRDEDGAITKVRALVRRSEPELIFALEEEGAREYTI